MSEVSIKRTLVFIAMRDLNFRLVECSHILSEASTRFNASPPNDGAKMPRAVET